MLSNVNWDQVLPLAILVILILSRVALSRAGIST